MPRDNQKENIMTNTIQKALIPLAIALSIATTACTGLTAQTGPTLSRQIAEEQRATSLWGELGALQVPNGVVEVEDRTDRDLFELWPGAVAESRLHGASDEASPRATAVLQKLTLTRSVFGSHNNQAQVLPQ